MKKSILLLGALALSASAAFAQIESPYLKITPKAGSELTELTNDVKVVISDEVGTVTNAVIQTGMLVVKNASNEDVKNLAPGMYIINGQKVAVK